MPTPAAAPDPDRAHRAHYAAFFDATLRPEGYGLVVGNCQAESLRIVIDSPTRPTVRVPPVHELTAHETGILHELLRDARFFVAQPVRDDYHGLPLGTRQLLDALPSRATRATFTPVRFAALYPFQASLHVPGVEEVPPLIGYHDVRTLAAAAGLPVAESLSPDAVRAVADDSRDELRRREQRTDVAVSDLLRPVAAHMRTINHPGNEMWMPLAHRILEALALADTDPTDPGRPLLNAVHAPLEPWATAAWGEHDAPRAHWIVDGSPVDPADVEAAHRDWYARHPAFVTGAVERLRPLLARWRRA